MKKIIAVLAALAMMISLAACGNYEITIKKNEDEKTQASDTVIEENDDETEEEKEEKVNKKEDSEDEPAEEETEIIIEGVPDFTNDMKKNKKLVEAYLRSLIDFDDFEDEENDDYTGGSLAYLKTNYFREDFTDAGIDYEIEIDGNSISFPTDLETLEECGFDFKSATYNSDSELNKNTYSDFNMVNSDEEEFSARFLNNESSSSALSDCIVTRAQFNLDSGDTVDFSFNGIDKNSDIEDIVAEFGTPNRLGYEAYDDGRVFVYIYYLNWGDNKDWEEDSLYISYELTEDRIDMITYEIPMYSFD